MGRGGWFPAYLERRAESTPAVRVLGQGDPSILFTAGVSAGERASAPTGACLRPAATGGTSRLPPANPQGCVI